MKKILIISMTGGFGHISAGNALLAYAEKNLPNVDAEHIDVSDINTSLKKYANLYDIIIKKYPFVWELIYKYSPFFSFLKKITFLKGLFEKKAKSYIYQKNPDAVIFTNVEIVPMFVFTLRKKFPHIKIGVVVTDYHGHSYYNNPGVDYYFVATLQVQKELEVAGIKKEKIVVTGIPINPKFYVKENTKNLKLKHGIKNDSPVVLFIASFKISINELLTIIRQLLNFKPRINIIFIANGNKEFYNIIKVNFPSNSQLTQVLWTDMMDEYMKISDVVISKAGGLTVSECFSLQKQLIIVNPIPGQEEYNANFVEKSNFGVKVKNIDEIITVLPEIILSSKNNQISLIEQKNPCEKIFEYIK